MLKVDYQRSDRTQGRSTVTSIGVDSRVQMLLILVSHLRGGMTAGAGASYPRESKN